MVHRRYFDLVDWFAMHYSYGRRALRLLDKPAKAAAVVCLKIRTGLCVAVLVGYSGSVYSKIRKCLDLGASIDFVDSVWPKIHTGLSCAGLLAGRTLGVLGQSNHHC